MPERKAHMAQMSSPRKNPVPGYRFAVFLDNLIMGFQKVTGMSREIETEVYREGGLNTEVHIFPKAFGGERVLRMEKGAYSGEEHIFCVPGEKLDKVLNLVVMDGLGNALKSYIFTGLLVKKWEVGELSAEQNSILIDSFEVCYEDFFAVK